MNKKKIIITAVTLLILAVIGVIYVSYGYVTSDIINENSKGKYYVVENLRIEYSDGTEMLNSKQDDIFIPGSVITKTFTIKNTGNKVLNYNILFTDIINTFNRKNDIIYEIYVGDVLLSSAVFPSTYINYVVGDLNFDNIINDDDYNLLNNFFDNNVTLSNLQMVAADLNLDNAITEEDSPELIREYIDTYSNLNIDDETDDNIILETNIGKVQTTTNVETILDNQNLEVNASTTYTLKIKYLNSQDNQIEDSGKTIDAKISFEQS